VIWFQIDLAGPINKYPRVGSNSEAETYDSVSGYATELEAVGAESGAVGARDADLRLLYEVWSELPDDAVAAIMQVVRRAAGRQL
jgi:hypothetical protein